MSLIDPARKPILNAACEALAREVGVHPLLLADGLLDEARRVALLCNFSGAGIERAREFLQVSPAIVHLARHFAGLSAAEVVHVDGLVRLYLWPAHFATMPGTAFGEQFAAAMQLAQAADAGAKPH